MSSLLSGSKAELKKKQRRLISLYKRGLIIIIIISALAEAHTVEPGP